MTLVLNGGGGGPSYKAATGPNPQSSQAAKNTTGYTGAGNISQAPAANRGVTQPGAAAIQPGAVAPPPAAPAPPTGQYDYSTDPIYQMIMAQQGLAIQQAQSASLAQQQQALIAYGSPSLAMALLGDQNVASAAAANSSSTLAQLAATNQQNVRGINNTENQNNLFYSSDRGYQLGLNQQAYLNNQSSAASNVQGNLSSIQAQLLAQEQAAYNAEAQGAQDAYNRAIAQAQAAAQSQSFASPQSGGGGSPAPVATGNENMGTNVYGGANPAAAPGTTLPATANSPYTANITANKTGGSANQRQGIFSTH